MARAANRSRNLDAGVRDMVRISDVRMSGTVVLHVCPEAAIGGPLALVRDGDPIELDVSNRTLNAVISEEEMAHRPSSIAPSRGVLADRSGKHW